MFTVADPDGEGDGTDLGSEEARSYAARHEALPEPCSSARVYCGSNSRRRDAELEMRESTGIGSAVLATVVVLLTGCSSLAPPRQSLQPIASASVVRQTTEGPVQGFDGPYGSHAWLGIPFAHPPVGELRWRAPRPPERREGTLVAVEPPPACPQYANPIGGVSGPAGQVMGDEDCLYLNIWAPRFSAADLPTGNERLPVMVWIHGGGNTIGTGSSYEGARLATLHGVIVVTLNYRLGPLGWFRHPALHSAESSPADASGNYGTLDLIRALQWVQANAAEFGGDASRVTIFGESAGGLNVFSLLASPLATGLFRGAIVQSGRPAAVAISEAENRVDAAPPGSALSGREASLRLLVAQSRAADRTEAARIEDATRPEETAGLLRSASASEILGLYRSAQDASREPLRMPLVFGDGYVLPERNLAEYFASPEGVPQVPVMMGTNRDEVRLFQLAAGDGVRNLLGIFPRAEDPERYVRDAFYPSAVWKATGADEVAAEWVRLGAPDVWVYRFDWDEEPASFVADMGLLLGAAHGMEIPFVFGRFEFGPLSALIFTDANEPGRRILSESMMAYWAEFAWNGDPGRGRARSLPRWQRWSEASADSPRFMVFDTAADGGLRMSSEAVTRDRIVKQLTDDPLYDSREARCSMMSAATRGGDPWNREHLDEAGCSPTPPVAAGSGQE